MYLLLDLYLIWFSLMYYGLISFYDESRNFLLDQEKLRITLANKKKANYLCHIKKNTYQRQQSDIHLASYFNCISLL